MHPNYATSLGPGETPDLSWCGLRNYQEQCLLRIHQAQQEQVRRMLISLPTGTGKTVVFSHLPHAIHIPKRLLVLAHRRELLEQARNKLAEYNPSKRIGIEGGSRHAAPTDDIIVASLDALKHKTGTRLAAMGRETVSHIIYDECHHAAAKDTLLFLRRIGCFNRDDLTLIGFTATPFRTDGINLHQVFERTVYHRTLEEMIREKWLAPIRAYRIQSSVDISHVRMSHGDFIDRELEEAVNTPARNALVLRTYLQMGEGYPCIIFCAGVHHAQSIADRFVAEQIPAGCVHGELPIPERERLIQSFKLGGLKILTNFNVLTEGFDAPATRLMILARPTTSGIVLAQSVGRVTRLDPASGKTYATVVEIADAYPKTKVLGVGQLFNLNPKFNAEGRDLLVVKDAVEAIQDASEGQIDPQQFETAEQVARVVGKMRDHRKRTRPKKSKKKRKQDQSRRAPVSKKTPKDGDLDEYESLDLETSATPVAPSAPSPNPNNTPPPTIDEAQASPPDARGSSESHAPLMDNPETFYEDDDEEDEEEEDPLDQIYQELEIKLSADHLFTMARIANPKLRTPTPKATEVVPLEPIPFADPMSAEEFQSRLEESDLLDKLSRAMPANMGKFAWYRTGTAQISIALAHVGRIEITIDLIGQYVITLYTAKPDNPFHETTTCLGVADTETKAVATAEIWIRKFKPEVCILLDGDASWRKRKPTEKQLGLMRSYGIPIPDGMTRGMATDLITQYDHGNR